MEGHHLYGKTFASIPLLLLFSLISANASCGKILLANDEWTFTQTGFSQPIIDPGIFATNVGSWFTGGSAGNFLAYSTNFGLTGSALQSAMTSAGHNWTVSTGINFDLATLLTYDGIFLAGDAADNAVLLDYVNAGGNVYLAGGTGWGGGSVAEANRWNSFLNSFGLGFGSSYNGVGGNIAIDSTHALFSGVDHLYQNNGNDALDINLFNPNAQLLVSYNGHGLYAVYDDTSVDVAEPKALALFCIGILGLGFLTRMGRRRSVTM